MIGEKPMKKLEVIDLRSDTVTLPTKEMLEAIRHAKLGDDVFKEDSTVNELERLAAKKMGKEASLLVSSGTQANLIAIMSNCKWGDSVILERESHINWYEAGGIASIGNVFPLSVKGKNGILDLTEVEMMIRPKDLHFSPTSLLCIENTHNRAGGTIINPTEIKKMKKVAEKHNLKLYMDGARTFNASVALKTDVKQFTKFADNLMFCLSKGLCCPIGSMLVGKHEFIDTARKMRKILGGGMRQSGVIAAPGIIALEKMIDRLEEDHNNAKLLASGLGSIKGITIKEETVQTNIVNIYIEKLRVKTSKLVLKLKDQGVLALAEGNMKIRMVTHRGIEKEHIQKTVSVVENVLKNLKV